MRFLWDIATIKFRHACAGGKFIVHVRAARVHRGLLDRVSHELSGGRGYTELPVEGALHSRTIRDRGR